MGFGGAPANDQVFFSAYYLALVDRKQLFAPTALALGDSRDSGVSFISLFIRSFQLPYPTLDQ
jgi:hypothetical protein